MKELCGNIKGELWKMRHTLLYWLHVLIPMIGIFVFLLYYRFAAWSDEGSISGYIQVLSVTLPLVVSAVCSMSAELEEKGHFQTFLGVSVYKSNPLFAKWIVLSGMGFASILLSVLGFAAGYWFMKGRLVLFVGEYLILAAVLWLCGVDLYLIHIFLNLAFSKGISLCAGTAELLASALFLTGLGEGRWQFLPCSWGGRWVGYLLQYWNGKGAVSAKYVTMSLGIGLLITSVLWVLFFLWFHFYEGRQCRD